MFKPKTIKFIFIQTQDIIYDVQKSENLKSFTNLFSLLEYMKNNKYFDENDIVEVCYVEDAEKIEKLNRILEVLEEDE